MLIITKPGIAVTSLQILIPELRTVSASLQKGTDELNAILEEIEKFIAELNIGVEVWLPLGDYKSGYQFGYARTRGPKASVSKPWGLCLKGPTEADFWRREEIPRKARVLMVPMLPLVLAELKKVGSELSRSTATACEEAGQILQNLHVGTQAHSAIEPE